MSLEAISQLKELPSPRWVSRGIILLSWPGVSSEFPVPKEDFTSRAWEIQDMKVAISHAPGSVWETPEFTGGQTLQGSWWGQGERSGPAFFT